MSGSLNELPEMRASHFQCLYTVPTECSNSCCLAPAPCLICSSYHPKSLPFISGPYGNSQLLFNRQTSEQQPLLLSRKPRTKPGRGATFHSRPPLCQLLTIIYSPRRDYARSSSAPVEAVMQAWSRFPPLEPEAHLDSSRNNFMHL